MFFDLKTSFLAPWGKREKDLEAGGICFFSRKIMKYRGNPKEKNRCGQKPTKATVVLRLFASRAVV